MKSLAIITGASKGIGLAAAARYRAEGWDVVNLSRSPCSVAGVVNQACDLRDLLGLDKTLARLDLKPFGRVSIVHNAAVTRSDTYETASGQDVEEVFKVNVVAPQALNRRLLPRLPQGSSVIFVGSTLSEVGSRNSLSYTVSKHALAGLMRSTAQDLAGKGIHTCLVCPGFTDTQMLRDIVGDQKERWDGIKSSVLFGRLIAPEEIAALLFFCSANPSINGAVLHANLGQR
jgi:NAD(P)-dependent dehydrogenase (short-subunit alcohol dehydrogenase family)